ncbi:MAG: dehydrogenase [Saprospiraceae bacterium]|nr:dehydrogenase [Saprospiraceae bacterium]
MCIRSIIVPFTFVGILFTSCNPALYDDPKTPEESLASMQLADGFTIDLFASEPHVMDPVEILFDDQGRVFAVEMPDYPFMPELDQGKGRIVQLHDADQDGQIDGRTVFLDSITEATSILPWKDGFLVTAAPFIYLIKDVDQDGKADSKEIIFSGFFENNSEAQITNLKYNIDNWIYAANNGQAGEITFHRNDSDKKLNVGGSDFRFRLDRGEFAGASGGAQFGHAINLEGHRFITQNTLHIRHVVIPWNYLNRHPHLPGTNVAFNISDHELDMFQQTPPPYWRAERTRRRQIQYKEQNLDRVEYAEDHFTGCSGGTFYAGDAFPESYLGSIFTGDVAGNLIHRDILEPLEDSPTYVAKRAVEEQEKEFLSSTDSWFRPANLTVGPDGYLYVIDMYRQHIETPLSIPEDLKEDMDFLNGDQLGRIYRIRPSGSEIKTGHPNLKAMTSDQLVILLEHPNRWQRINAQRILIERQDTSIIKSLKNLFENHATGIVRLHAFYTLEGLNVLDFSTAVKATGDPYRGLREHGLRQLGQDEQVIPTIVNHLEDPDVRIALQAVLSLGNFSGPQIETALASALLRYYQEPWFRMAILSSREGSDMDFLRHLEKMEFLLQMDEDKIKYLSDLSYIIGHRNQENELTDLTSFLLNERGENKIEGADQIIVSLLNGIKKNSEKIKLPASLLMKINTMKEDSNYKIMVDDILRLNEPI